MHEKDSMRGRSAARPHARRLEKTRSWRSSRRSETNLRHGGEAAETWRNFESEHTFAGSIRSIRALRAKPPLHFHQWWVMTMEVDLKPSRKRRQWELAKHARQVISQPKQPNRCIALAGNRFRLTLKG